MDSEVLTLLTRDTPTENNAEEVPFEDVLDSIGRVRLEPVSDDNCPSDVLTFQSVLELIWLELVNCIELLVWLRSVSLDGLKPEPVTLAFT